MGKIETWHILVACILVVITTFFLPINPVIEEQSSISYSSDREECELSLQYSAVGDCFPEECIFVSDPFGDYLESCINDCMPLLGGFIDVEQQVSILRDKWVFHDVAPGWHLISEYEKCEFRCFHGDICDTACNTYADTNCDGEVSRDELGDYISDWINGNIYRTDLGYAIQAWVEG